MMRFESVEKRNSASTGWKLCLLLMPIIGLIFIAAPTLSFKYANFPPLYSTYLFLFNLVFDLIIIVFCFFRYLTRRNSVCLLFLLAGFLFSTMTDVVILFYHPVFNGNNDFIYENKEMIVILYLFRIAVLCYFMLIAAALKIKHYRVFKFKHLLAFIPGLVICAAFLFHGQSTDIAHALHLHPRVIYYNVANVCCLLFILSICYYIGFNDSFWSGLMLFSLLMLTSLQYGSHGIHFEDRYWNTMLSVQTIGYFFAILFFLKNVYDRLKVSIDYSEIIYEKSITDPLTGIYNRGFFIEKLRESISEYKNRTLALFIIDIDYFKSINDHFGHGTGDNVIKLIASELTAHIGDRGVVARIGGEEFAVMLPEISEEEARQLAACILEKVRNRPPVSNHDFSQQLTVSLGMYFSHHHHEELSLISRADEALYYAKRNGRDRYASWKEMQNDGQQGATHCAVW